MKSLIEHFDNVSGASRHAAKAASILGAAAPSTALVPAGHRTWRDALDDLRAKAGPDVEDNYGKGAIGAVAGAYLWDRHRVLGALGGFALGRNVPALFGGDRRLALCNLAVVGAAVAASIYVPGHPVLALLGGGLVAGTAIHFAGWRK